MSSNISDGAWSMTSMGCEGTTLDESIAEEMLLL